jgi:acetyl-CoA synthetase
MNDRHAQICAAFRWQVPADFNIAHWACRRWAGERHRLALHWEDESRATESWRYWQILEGANRLANALGALGVSRGDRVALILPQRPETVVAYLAAFQMGAIAVPLSFLFGPEALEFRLADSGAKVAIVDPQTAANLEPARALRRRPSLAHERRRRPLLDWDATLAAARAFDPVPRARIPRRSSTPAAPRAAERRAAASAFSATCRARALARRFRSRRSLLVPADWAWTGGCGTRSCPPLSRPRSSAIPGASSRARVPPAGEVRGAQRFPLPTALR